MQICVLGPDHPKFFRELWSCGPETQIYTSLSNGDTSAFSEWVLLYLLYLMSDSNQGNCHDEDIKPTSFIPEKRAWIAYRHFVIVIMIFSKMMDSGNIPC